MNIAGRPNRKKDKIFYFAEWGRGKGARRALDIFTYVTPKNQTEKNHNKEALAILAVKKSGLILDQQSTGTGYIPAHRFKDNFLDHYADFVKNNKEDNNRHLSNSFTQFKKFLGKDFLPPIEVTEELCTRFRQYLLKNFNGDTPANYFARFKRVIKAATKEGYYRYNPAEDVKAKSNPPHILKDFLEANEYLDLLKTPCLNMEVKEAFVLSCYTGLRWCDVQYLSWDDIRGEKLQTRLIQAKTGELIWITLHPIAKAILEKRKADKGEQATGHVFYLPSHTAALEVLKKWVRDAPKKLNAIGTRIN